ncbi:hypothetical protein B0H19DRAFT_1085191 [Mycena capillaripes]|nr:hypothetical protein B0H19DRAFT_1085191 [Mycena capillaripes]
MALLLALCASAARNMAVRRCSRPVPNGTPADYFYSALNAEIDAVGRGDGYNFGGVVCLVFGTQELSTVPLFHLFGRTTSERYQHIIALYGAIECNHVKPTLSMESKIQA